MKDHVKLAMAARFHRGIKALRKRIAEYGVKRDESIEGAAVVDLLTAVLYDFGAEMPVPAPVVKETVATDSSETVTT